MELHLMLNAVMWAGPTCRAQGKLLTKELEGKVMPVIHSRKPAPFMDEVTEGTRKGMAGASAEISSASAIA
jgi:hypothetical protein